MAEHTPGPWTTTLGTGVFRDQKCIYIKGSTDEVALIRYADQPSDTANAALICAAPDLLAACEGLVDLLGRSYDADTFAVQYLAAQLSIAKARGELEL